MLFNSIDFAIFLPIVFFLYWFVTNRSLQLQNCLIVVASYIFYGWWDWRFLSFIFASSLLDYLVGLGLMNEQNQLKRKLLLWTSMVANLGFLGFFKYYNFFLENFIEAFTFMGMPIQATTLNIVLPVGISFYTFQTMSYSIDVYRGNLKPTKDFVAFSAFVTFFPQLVAGPIERATNLLPQFYKKRVFDYDLAVNGMRQILWGLLKKLVIADNCATYANLIFNSPEDFSGSTLLLGAFFFTFQIYGDFSGYSDIAIGTSRLFGFDLMRNFAFPYFSRDIAEFWRRWHISLSTWFRDYLYFPLGGSQGGTWIKVRNTFIIFIVSGFWHGSKWTFVVWGVLNALYFLPLLLTKRNRNNLGPIAENRFLPSFREFLGISTTFLLCVFAWIFFRADSMQHAIDFIQNMFSSSLFTLPDFDGIKRAYVLLLLIAVFICVEWLGRHRQFAIEYMAVKWKRPVRWAFYSFCVFILGMFMQTEETPFIYFQF